MQGMHKLCGQELNNALEAVCYGVGYNAMAKRRSEDHDTAAASHPGYKLSPVLSSIYGTEVLIKSRRLRRQNGGIYDECCVKACSYYELKAYCRQK
ncbi:hypothetical protein KR093_000960 [Drosophila rubida]|uniref:Insulin-like domain-containing protein n=1 Tax=Drosophila rubida TaxID=30044 RepID=A0AAD4PK50_9MUSC|nr:hypothetical protein KR093_000960 [Drosophila rubida]